MLVRISKANHLYGNRMIMVGDTFQVDPRHVKILLALNRIEPIKGEDGFIELEPEINPKRQYKRARTE